MPYSLLVALLLYHSANCLFSRTITITITITIASAILACGFYTLACFIHRHVPPFYNSYILDTHHKPSKNRLARNYTIGLAESCDMAQDT